MQKTQKLGTLETISHKRSSSLTAEQELAKKQVEIDLEKPSNVEHVNLQAHLEKHYDILKQYCCYEKPVHRRGRRPLRS